jgi:TRAF3-interacting protein 1
MRNDLDDNAVWITVTQTKLERIIKKPKLTVKLLSRPPFRFIHDIVMEVMRCTGFGETLFGDEDRDSNQFSVRIIV